MTEGGEQMSSASAWLSPPSAKDKKKQTRQKNRPVIPKSLMSSRTRQLLRRLGKAPGWKLPCRSERHAECGAESRGLAGSASGPEARLGPLTLDMPLTRIQNCGTHVTQLQEHNDRIRREE